MKKTTIVLALVLVLFACKKNTTSGSNDVKNLSGKWKLTEQLVSPGPIGEWKPVNTNPASYVEFTKKGDIISSTLFTGYTKYEFNGDSTKLILKSSSGLTTLELYFKLEYPKLSISLPCIEPCGMRFKKVN